MSESEKKMTHIKDRLRRNLWQQEENEKQQEEDTKLNVLSLPELFYPEDVVFLLSEIYELEAENKQLREQNQGLLAENQRMHGTLSSIAAERKNRDFWAKY